MKALNHEEPDRVPIDLGGMRSTGISAVAYNKLKKHLGITTGETRIYDTWQQLADPEPEILELFHTDVLQLYRFTSNWGLKLYSFKPGTCADGSPAMVPENLNPVVSPDGSKEIRGPEGELLAKMPANGYYYENMYHPLTDVASIEELDDLFKFPALSDEEADKLEERAKYLYEKTDKAILGEFIGTFYEQGQADFGYENYYYNIAAEKELIHHYNERLLEVYLANLKKYLSKVGKYINVIHFGDDLGTQVSLQISVNMYREMIKPYARELYQYVHTHYPHIKCFMHSCGAIYQLIPEFIDIGVDVLNPVQITAKGMDPMALKKNFGDKISFWGGGIETTTIATNGTPDEVEENVRHLMSVFKPYGGFIWNTVHNIQQNVPCENIVRMFEAAYKYGKYE
jgi:uroporphyrinogen decarboxylase